MTVCSVPIEHLSFIWPRARPFVVKALERDDSGRYEAEDILRLLISGDARLWVAWDDAVQAAIITQIIQYPRLRELRIWLVGGGNMKSWVNEATELLEGFGRASGCALIAGGMRRGWVRMGNAATGGWKETGFTFHKRL